MTSRLADCLFWIGIGLLATAGILMLAGCSKDQPPPVLNPGARAVVYSNGQQLWAVCDKGNLAYLGKNGSFQIIPAGCPDGQP